MHRVAVFYEGAEGAGCDQHIGQLLVAVEQQLITLTRCQGQRAAHLRQHHALVAHLGRQQRNVAAQA